MNKLISDHIIGTISSKPDAPLLIVVGGMHGNETAGVQALHSFLAHIATYPDCVQMNFVGLVGNLQAINTGQRFIDEDLNRLWNKEMVSRVQGEHPGFESSERQALREMLMVFNYLLETYPNSPKFILDLHTTSARGGIFSIINNHETVVDLAAHLGVPMISGLHAELHGTLLGYFADQGIPGLGIETGQHKDHEAVRNAISIIWTVMHQMGGFVEDMFNRELDYHYIRLRNVAADLPPKVEVLYRHPIAYGDEFRMAAEFKNFQPIEAGELIAYDRNGPVIAREEGLLLMPLYQKIGEDGFFIVRELDKN